MICCPSAVTTTFLFLTLSTLKAADSELLFVDPARPRHCTLPLISHGPHLAKTPSKAICPDPRSADIFAQPQCVLACSAEHHMWQDVCNGGRKALVSHLWTLFIRRPCYLDVCRGSLASMGWTDEDNLFCFRSLIPLWGFFSPRTGKSWTAATSSEQPAQPKA